MHSERERGSNAFSKERFLLVVDARFVPLVQKRAEQSTQQAEMPGKRPIVILTAPRSS